MMWLNRSVATIIATLQLLDIYRFYRVTLLSSIVINQPKEKSSSIKTLNLKMRRYTRE